MSTIGAIVIDFDADTGKVTAKIRATEGALRSFEKATDNADRRLRNIERSVGGFGAKLRDTVVVLGQARAAMHTLYAIGGQWITNIVRQNAELERMQILMEGLSKETDNAARKLEGLASLNFTIDMARNAPFQLQELTNTFVKFKSAGIDPTKGSMQALVDATAAFGGSDQLLHRASIAIQQMSGKGVISMEELRQQLGEAIPSAMKLLARSANMTMGELSKAIATGTVSAEALQRLFSEFDFEFEGAGKRMMQTFVGLTSQIKTEWMLLAKEIGEQGLFPAIKQGLIDVIALMKSPEGRQAARDLGQALGEVINGLIQLIRWVTVNREAIGELLKIVVAFKAASMIAPALLAGWTALIGVIRGAAAAMTAGAGATALATGGLRALFALISAHPIGLLVTALTAAAYGFYKFQESADAARASLAELQSLASSNELIPSTKIDEAATGIQALKEEMDGLVKSMRNRSIVGKENTRERVRDLAEMLGLNPDEATFEQVKALAEQRFSEFNTFLAKQRDAGMAAAISSGNESVQSGLAAAMEPMLQQARKAREQIQIELEEAGGGPEAVQAARAKTAQLLNDTLDGQKTVYVAAMNKIAELIRTASDDTSRTAFEGMRANMIDSYRSMVEGVVTQLRLNSTGIERLTTPGGQDQAAKAKQDSFKTYLESLRAKVADLRADLSGASDGMAKFLSLVNDGRYGAVSAAQIEQVRALISAEEALSAAKAIRAQREKTIADVTENTAAIRARLLADLESTTAALSGNVMESAAGGMVGLNRQIAVMAAQLSKMGDLTPEMQQLFDTLRGIQSQVDGNEFISEMRKIEDAAFVGSSNESRTRAARALQFQIDQIMQRRDILLKDAQNRVEIEEAAQEAILALQKQFAERQKPQWQKMLDDWADMSKGMENVWVNAMGALEGAIDEFVRTGKLNFADLVTSILADIAKMMLNKAVSDFLMMMLNGFGGYGANGFGSNGPVMSRIDFAKGGVMTEAGSVPLRKYASGGIANSPQLAMFGEGSMPEAYVPLPDGRAIPVKMEGGGGANVAINIINQTDKPFDAEQGEMKFDGNQYIIDVVLKAANRAGPFRDAMRSAVR